MEDYGTELTGCCLAGCWTTHTETCFWIGTLHALIFYGYYSLYVELNDWHVGDEKC
jgi:hypothetical protein